MKLVNALLGTTLSFFALSAQSQTLDSIAVSTKYLDEVVITDSRFALKRSQSGKTVVKIKQEEIQQFSGLGLALNPRIGINPNPDLILKYDLTKEYPVRKYNKTRN